MKTARTTVELDRELLKKAKQKAVEEDKSLKQIMGEALEKTLAAPKEKKTPKRIKIRVYDMGEIKGALGREEIYDWL